MKNLVIAAAIGMLVGACGATGIGTASPPSPSPSGHRFDVSATDLDHAVTVRVGQRLEVVLHAKSGMRDWTHPISSDPAVLAPIVDPAATAAIGVTLAAFKAEKPGTVEVGASAGPKCPSGAPCPAYLIGYSLTVTVTA